MLSHSLLNELHELNWWSYLQMWLSWSLLVTVLEIDLEIELETELENWLVELETELVNWLEILWVK